MSSPAPAPPSPNPDRRQLIAAAALDVLAEHGARGLTHRRVDQQAGLPMGSTSNVFRTRDALLEGTLDHLIRVDFTEADGAVLAPLTVEQAAEVIASLIERWVAPQGRSLLLARYELWLEASRRPDFAEVLRGRRAGVLGLARQLVDAVGLDDPATRATNFMLWVDGVLLDHILDPAQAFDSQALRRMATMQLS